MNNKIRNDFSWLQPHKSFLLDEMRNQAYLGAIKRAAGEGKTAFEIGAGTGLLSFFAAKAGFAKVVSVEKSELAKYANKVANDNGLAGKVEFLRKDLFRFKTSTRFDTLIHEQIGTFIWDEDMVRKVHFAREHVLKKGGRIIPHQVDFHLAPIAMPVQENHPFFWEVPRYGISFKSFRELEERQQKRRPILRAIRLKNEKLFLARPKSVVSTDLYRDKEIPKKISATFTLQGRRIMTGFIGYMTVHLDSHHRFTNHPGSTIHWPQFYLALPSGHIPTSREVRVDIFPSLDPSRWRWTVY
jgi:predicted RNA methylase